MPTTQPRGQAPFQIKRGTVRLAQQRLGEASGFHDEDAGALRGDTIYCCGKRKAKFAATPLLALTRPSKLGASNIDSENVMIPSTSQPWMAKSGTPVTIRPVRKDDFELAQEFVRGLAPATGYQRLMSPRKPSLEELRRWTDIDPALEMALVATVTADGREREVGVARYVIEPTSREAEFAIVLADEWQGRGLGRELLSRLLVAAQRAGLRRVVGTTLSDNAAMLRLAGGMGFKRTRVSGAAMITALTMDLSAWTPECVRHPELPKAA